MPNRLSPSDLVVHELGRSSGPTVILLHGLTDSALCWPDAVRRWGGVYRVLAVDARGHGSSPRWTDEHLRAGVGEALRDDLIAVLEDLAATGSELPVLIGHSMGAGSAAVVAATRPDMVLAVVLEDPAIPWRNADELAQVARERLESTQRFIHDIDVGGVVDPGGGHPWPEVELAPWALAKTQVDTGLLATGLACLTTPWQEAWGGIAVPSLLVTGDGDVVFNPRRLGEVAGLRNPSIAVTVVPDADHCVRRDNPNGYHAIVDPWVASMFT